jgi:hypothetical protein
MSFGQRAASISWLAALVGKLDPQGRKPRYESGRDRRRLPFWCGSVTLRPGCTGQPFASWGQLITGLITALITQVRQQNRSFSDFL